MHAMRSPGTEHVLFAGMLVSNLGNLHVDMRVLTAISAAGFERNQRAGCEPGIFHFVREKNLL